MTEVWTYQYDFQPFPKFLLALDKIFKNVNKLNKNTLKIYHHLQNGNFENINKIMGCFILDETNCAYIKKMLR